MNQTRVQELLKRWSVIIEIGERASRTKASKGGAGLMARIRRTTGKPVIFDFETYEDQKEIQNFLCKELPKWSDIILSKPEIMDGNAWTRGDFIELYYEHFRLVSQKLQRITNKAAAV